MRGQAKGFKSQWVLPSGALCAWLAICVALGTPVFGCLWFSVQLAVAFSIGYAGVVIWQARITLLTVVLSIALGIELAATIYAIGCAIGHPPLAYAGLSAFAAAGVWQCHRALRSKWAVGKGERSFLAYASMAAIATMLFIGSSFVFSGRVQPAGIAFYGPMGRDHIFHLALIAQLQKSVPPDNFVVSGFPFPPYHFLPDLIQVLLLKTSLGLYSVLDLYYRLYPGVLYFLIGFLSYWVSARLTASRIGGWIGLALLLFGADFTWIIGSLRALIWLPNLSMAMERTFDPWIQFTGFGTLYPLVHRPAYYHGLLLLLAGLACVLGRNSERARSWAVAGLIWGFMAGFNYTLAVVLGLSLAAICCLCLVQGTRRARALHLALCAACMIIASLPESIFVLTSMREIGGSTHLLQFVPGALPLQEYGAQFGRLHSSLAVLVASSATFVVLSYGLRLVGIWSLARMTLGRFRANGELGAILAGTFALSVAIGYLFVDGTYGEVANNIILFQPTGWFLALFAIAPLAIWLKRNEKVRTFGLAFLLLVGGVQAVPLFNAQYRIVMPAGLLSGLEHVRAQAGPHDVIAFLPDNIRSQPILGPAPTANNFYFSAFTGLPAFYSTKGYTGSFSEASGQTDVYAARKRLVERVAAGTAGESELNELLSKHVRWIVLPAATAAANGRRIEVFWTTPEHVILRLRDAERRQAFH